MPPVILVHLSDIHFTSGDTGLEVRRDAVRADLIADLAVMRGTVGDATAILVTGDIAQAAEPAEYDRAARWFDEVAAAAGADRAQVLTVPGNHDVHWGSIGPSGQLARASLRDCHLDGLTTALDGLLADPARPLVAPLQNYSVFAQGYDCSVPDDGRAWERELPLSGGYRLAIRGLTTVFNSDAADAEATLIVGGTQMSMMTKPGVVRLLMAHHGPEACRDRVAIRDRINGKAAILLCGHLHDQRPNLINGYLEVTAAAVHPEEQPGYNPTYNWVQIDVESDGINDPMIVVKLWQREWRQVWNKFGPVTSVSGAELQQWTLAPCCPAPPSFPQQKSVPESSSISDEGTESIEEEVGAITRSPLTDEYGHATEDRQVARALLDLTPTVRLRVLLDLGLIDDNDLYQNQATMLGLALERAAERGTLQGLAAAIETNRR
jgi:hypothetical protein